MDHPLVEWLATLPANLKIRGQEGKVPAEEGHGAAAVPHDILYRPEDGLCRAAGALVPRPLRERVQDAVLGPHLADTGWFNRKLPEAPGRSPPERQPRLQRAAVDAADVRGLPAPRASASSHAPRCSPWPCRPDAAPRAVRCACLHVLDHSIPLHSGYTFRTLAILREQQRLGWETLHLTTPKQGAGDVPRRNASTACTFYRTPSRPAPARPAGADAADGRRASLEVVDAHQPDVVHAHSPVLNALPALWVRLSRRVPVVYEMRAFVGRRRRRPRHHHRRQPALPAVARAGELCAAPRRPGDHHLRRPARRHRGARHRGRSQSP